MKRSSVLFMFLIWLCFKPFLAEAQQERQSAMTFQKYSKWGIGIDFSRSALKIGYEEAFDRYTEDEIYLIPILLDGNTGPQLNIYYNLRVARFLYYQPEITYAIYNYPMDDFKLRSMFMRITPIQFQFGVHFGWARPYIFAGAELNVAINIRDMSSKVTSMETSGVEFDKFSNRLSWGYTYGGGIDFLSFIQLQYRRHLWMNNFTSFTKSWQLVDEALCVSFFF